MENSCKLIILDRICRCCLAERTEMKPIFDENLPELLLTCGNINVTDSDGLPSLICFQCVQQLKKSFTFRQQCERSDTTLRHWFHTSMAETAITFPSTTASTVTNNKTVSSTDIQYEVFNVLVDVGNTTLSSAAVMLPMEDTENGTTNNGIVLMQSQSDITSCLVDVANEGDKLRMALKNVIDVPTQLEENEGSEKLLENSFDSENSDAKTKFGLASDDEQDELINVDFLNDKIMPDISGNFSDALTNDYMELIRVSPDELNQHRNQDRSEKDLNFESSMKSGKSERKEKSEIKGNVECDICHKFIKGRKAYNRHKKLHSEIRPYVCKYCNKSFPEACNLTKHMRRHTGEKPFMCPVCGTRFYENNVLKIHMRVHTGEKPFECQDCGKTFAQTSQLFVHKKTHNSIKSHICSICNRGFKLPWQLKIHNRIHTNEKPYKCPHCDKRFAQSGNLVNHIRIHTGEKRFMCSECGKGFVGKGELQVHMRKHTGEKPEMKVTCTICGKKYPNNGVLKIHMRTHSGEKPYTCSVCNKNFLLHSHLSVHMRAAHTGERPYSCDICGKSFASSSILKKHHFIHTGEKNYPCHYCDRRFSQSSGRNTHQKSHFKIKAIKKLKNDIVGTAEQEINLSTGK